MTTVNDVLHELDLLYSDYLGAFSTQDNSQIEDQRFYLSKGFETLEQMFLEEFFSYHYSVMSNLNPTYQDTSTNSVEVNPWFYKIKTEEDKKQLDDQKAAEITYRNWCLKNDVPRRYNRLNYVIGG